VEKSESRRGSFSNCSEQPLPELFDREEPLLLPGLLRLELIEFSLLPFDLSLLRRHPPLHLVLLLLPSLHLVTDEGATYSPTAATAPAIPARQLEPCR